MYCTGGIRCDIYSAFLKQKGYKNMYTLHGGIQNYLVHQGRQHWNGSLFVFDGRMALSADNPSERAALAAFGRWSPSMLLADVGRLRVRCGCLPAATHATPHSWNVVQWYTFHAWWYGIQCS